MKAQSRFVCLHILIKSGLGSLQYVLWEEFYYGPDLLTTATA
jgi:hypothetical protein